MSTQRYYVRNGMLLSFNHFTCTFWVSIVVPILAFYGPLVIFLVTRNGCGVCKVIHLIVYSINEI